MISELALTSSAEYKDYVMANFDRLEFPQTTRLGSLEVMNDAIKLDGARLNASQAFSEYLALKIGEGWRLPYPDEVDAIAAFQGTIRNLPSPQPISATLKAMREHSARIDANLHGAQGLLLNAGKVWVSGAPKAKGYNYGWFIPTQQIQWRGIRIYPTATKLTGFKVIQQPSTFHSADHSDYSQTVRLVRASIW